MSLKSNQTLDGYSDKLCTTIALAYISGSIDCRSKGLWLAGVYVSLLIACRVYSHTQYTRMYWWMLQLNLHMFKEFCGYPHICGTGKGRVKLDVYISVWIPSGIQPTLKENYFEMCIYAHVCAYVCMCVCVWECVCVCVCLLPIEQYPSSKKSFFPLILCFLLTCSGLELFCLFSSLIVFLLIIFMYLHFKCCPLLLVEGQK